MLILARIRSAQASRRNTLSNKIKIALALPKTQFQNQGEAACDVPEMFDCLRVASKRVGCVSITFILFFLWFLLRVELR